MFKINKTAGSLTTALLIQRALDGECFTLLLGASSNSDYDVGAAISGTQPLEMPLGDAAFEQFNHLFKPRPFGQYSELQHHRVRVCKEEIIRDNNKIYLLDIEVKAYPKTPKAIELLEGAVDSLVPGQGRNTARKDFRDKMRRTLLPTRHITVTDSWSSNSTASTKKQET